MPNALQNPVTMLPVDSGTTIGQTHVCVAVRGMTWEHVNVWHTLVQPIINLNYQHWSPDVPSDDARADVGWDWGFNYSLMLLHNTCTYIPGNKSGPARALTLVVSTETGEEIPVGMLTVVPKFQCDVGGAARERTFAWYLSDAPKSFYTDVLGVDPLKGVAKALLDCAIQSGLDAAADGATLLHADPNGGTKLKEFYSRCAMQQVQLTNGPISMLRRTHVDQYFFMDSAAAKNYCSNLDVYR